MASDWPAFDVERGFARPSRCCTSPARCSASCASPMRPGPIMAGTRRFTRWRRGWRSSRLPSASGKLHADARSVPGRHRASRRGRRARPVPARPRQRRRASPMPDRNARLLTDCRRPSMASPMRFPVPCPLPKTSRRANIGPISPTACTPLWPGSSRCSIDFRAGFQGKASPVHFYWGSFDLAVTRFSGRLAPQHPGGIPGLPDRITREAYSHEESSAGFWPGGSDRRRADFYSYAYPEPGGFATPAVPPDAASLRRDAWRIRPALCRRFAGSPSRRAN